MEPSFCRIEKDAHENDYGTETPVVRAVCGATGVKSPWIWGDGEPSIRRALASLSGACHCGCFHQRREPPRPSRPGGRW